MTRAWATALVLVGMLAGCGDPLGDVERVSEGAVLPDAAASAALPSEQELARQDSILSGLFRRRDATEDAVDPLIAPTDLATEEATATQQGLDAVETGDASVSPAVDTASVETMPAEAPARGGLVGWLRRAAASEKLETEPVATPASLPADGAADDQLASLDPQGTGVEDPTPLVEPTKRRGIFGANRTAPRNGPDARDVAVGTILPFGEIARVCEANPRVLATLVERAARKGTGYNLYDSAPDSAAPRTFYVTGFSDKCPRQFTASLALFGTPEFHEQLRYGLPATEYPYSTTDKAYEKVKTKVCNAGRNKPCGSRISRLEKTTAFVSVYENFGENARWADLLLHDGAVLAAALKTP